VTNELSKSWRLSSRELFFAPYGDRFRTSAQLAGSENEGQGMAPVLVGSGLSPRLSVQLPVQQPVEQLWKTLRL
jgi:hypothetical protein